MQEEIEEHSDQSNFIKYYRSSSAKRVQNRNICEEDSVWSDSERSHNGYDKSLNYVELFKDGEQEFQNDIKSQIIKKHERQEKMQKLNKMNQLIKKLQTLSERRKQNSADNSTYQQEQQQLNSYISKDKQQILEGQYHENKMDHDQQFQNYKNFLIKFGYTKFKIGYFLKNFTRIKRTKNLNNVVRYYINDLSDEQVTKLNFKKLFSSLQARVNLDLEHYYQKNFKQEQIQNMGVLEKISADLKESLIKEYNKKILNKIQFLNSVFSDDVIEQTSLVLKEKYFFPNQEIKLDQDQNDFYLIYVIQGKIESHFKISVDQMSKNTIQKYKKGDTIGQYSFFTGIQSEQYFKSTEFTKVMILSRNSFIEITKKYDQEFEKFSEIKDQLLLYNQNKIVNLRCELCKQSSHFIQYCPFVSINRQAIYLKVKQFQNDCQNREEFNRKRFIFGNSLCLQKIVKQIAQDLIKSMKNPNEIAEDSMLSQMTQLEDTQTTYVENSQEQPSKEYQSQIENQSSIQNETNSILKTIITNNNNNSVLKNENKIHSKVNSEDDELSQIDVKSLQKNDIQANEKSVLSFIDPFISIKSGLEIIQNKSRKESFEKDIILARQKKDSHEFFIYKGEQSMNQIEEKNDKSQQFKTKNNQKLQRNSKSNIKQTENITNNQLDIQNIKSLQKQNSNLRQLIEELIKNQHTQYKYYPYQNYKTVNSTQYLLQGELINEYNPFYFESLRDYQFYFPESNSKILIIMFGQEKMHDNQSNFIKQRQTSSAKKIQDRYICDDESVWSDPDISNKPDPNQVQTQIGNQLFNDSEVKHEIQSTKQVQQQKNKQEHIDKQYEKQQTINRLKTLTIQRKQQASINNSTFQQGLNQYSFLSKHEQQAVEEDDDNFIFNSKIKNQACNDDCQLQSSQKVIGKFDNMRVKIAYFLKNFTRTKRTQNLNSIIRYRLNDLSDIIQIDSSIFFPFCYKIQSSLKARVNLDLEHYYKKNYKQEEIQNMQVLEKVSVDLQESLILEYNKKILNKIQFLNNTFSTEILEQASLLLKEQYFFPNQVIKLERDQHDFFLIYVLEGKIESHFNGSKESKSQNVIQKFKKGDTTGQYSFFTGIQNNQYLKSTEFTKLMILSRKNFMEIIKKNEKEFQKFNEIKDKLLFYNQFQIINLQCDICQQSSHFTIYCPNICMKKQQIYSQIQYLENQIQDRDEFQRKTLFRGNSLFYKQQIKQIAQDFIKQIMQNDYVVEDSNLNQLSSQEEIQTTLNEVIEENYSLNLNQQIYEEQFNFLNETSSKLKSIIYTNNNPHQKNESRIHQKFNSDFNEDEQYFQAEAKSSQKYDFQTFEKIEKQQTDYSSEMKSPLDKFQRNPSIEKDMISSKQKKETSDDNYISKNEQCQSQIEETDRSQKIIKKKIKKIMNTSKNSLKLLESNGSSQVEFQNQQTLQKFNTLYREFIDLITQKQKISFRTFTNINQKTNNSLRDLQFEIYNPFLLDSLKDYQYYFSDGNSKMVIPKFQKAQLRKAKALKKQMKSFKANTNQTFSY
ncbi:hypothetical protein ABPG73_009906 [Tetrahymena malaccensis]